MTLTELERRLEKGQPKHSQQLEKLFKISKNMTFEHWWMATNPPISQVTNHPSPLHQFQKNIIQTLERDRFVMVNKSRFSGMSECLSRYMVYQILHSDQPLESIGICSTNYQLAVSMCRRQKQFLNNLGVFDFDDQRETNIDFGKSRIQWYASDPLALRGLNPSGLVLADEFFHSGFNDIFSVIDSFTIRNPTVKVIGISTPGPPSGAGHAMWTSKQSIYKRLTINYQDCLGYMYTPEQLERLRIASPSFETEYSNKFAFSQQGNTFSTKSVDNAIINEEFEFEEWAPTWGGWDVGFSADSAGVIVQLVDGYIRVLWAKSYSQKSADFYQMVDECARLINEYGISKMAIDGSAPSFINAVSERVSSEPDVSAAIKRNRENRVEPLTGLRVVPISFGKSGRDLLYSCKMMLERGGIKIPKSNTDLIDFLRNCRDESGRMLKKLTPNNHIGDALLLSLKFLELDGGESNT